MINGRLTKKIAGHPPQTIRKPPRVGPSAVMADAKIDRTPSAEACFSCILERINPTPDGYIAPPDRLKKPHDQQSHKSRRKRRADRRDSNKQKPDQKQLLPAEHITELPGNRPRHRAGQIKGRYQPGHRCKRQVKFMLNTVKRKRNHRRVQWVQHRPRSHGRQEQDAAFLEIVILSVR